MLVALRTVRNTDNHPYTNTDTDRTYPHTHTNGHRSNTNTHTNGTDSYPDTEPDTHRPGGFANHVYKPRNVDGAVRTLSSRIA